MEWTKDGDQWVMTGHFGEYRITEMKLPLIGSSVFTLVRHRRDLPVPEVIGEFHSLSAAKTIALKHEGYHQLDT
jgi:hypothetical protein